MLGAKEGKKTVSELKVLVSSREEYPNPRDFDF